jgi:DNA-binding CsgD family transcriptional regulator
MSVVLAGPLLGRADEVAVVDAFLEGAGDGTRALVVEGEPGVGKTTVWRDGVARARERGFRVLQAQPAAAERELSFATLTDLLEPVADAFDELPRTRRLALDAALQRAESPVGADATALGLAVRTLLSAAGTPTLVAIDDIQWVDAESARILAFALRRPAGGSPIVFATLRSETPAGPALLEDAVDAGRLTRMGLSAFSLDELGVIVHQWLAAPISRPQLVRLWEASGGNAFFARELLLAGRAGRTAGEDFVLPLTPTLETVVGSRLQLASLRTRQAVAAVAAMARPTASLVCAATGAGAKQIAEAIDRDLLVLDGERLSVAHPLIASAAYYALPPARRRSLHERLSELCPTAEERALHLAAATSVPDELVAARLEDAAAEAARRGTPSAAATLLEHAVRLTPAAERDASSRRRLQQAAQRLVSGDVPGARTRLEALVGELEPGSERAAALCLLVDTRWDDLDAMKNLAERAAVEATDDLARARAHLKLAEVCFSTCDYRRADDEVSTALKLAEFGDDDATLALALAHRAQAEFLCGRGVDDELITRALALEDRLVDELPLYQAPSGQIGLALAYIGDVDRAEQLLRRQLERADQRGDEPARIGLLLSLGCVAHRRGDLATVERISIEVEAVFAQIGEAQGEAYGAFGRLYACTELGREAEARAHAEKTLAYAVPAGDHLMREGTLSMLAELELSKGDFAAAWRHLEGLPEELREWGKRETTVHPVHAPAIEALVGLGEVDRAAALADELEELIQPLALPTSLAILARSRGLIAAGTGDIPAALAQFDRALELHVPGDWPLEYPRTLLARGAALRRARHWRAAREAMQAARAVFEQFRYRLWVERTDAELKRIAGRSASAGLTPTETRVAQVIASGRSNKEAAAELSVTVRTIESNLSRIYAKLGIRSRTELAARLRHDTQNG